jgi:hypothetical protein
MPSLIVLVNLNPKGPRNPSSPADSPKILVRFPLRFTAGIDRDPLRALYRLRILRHRHRKNAIFESGAHGVLIDISIERDLALEATIEPLTVSAIAILGFDLLLATHGQEALLKQHFDVAFLHSQPITYLGRNWTAVQIIDSLILRSRRIDTRQCHPAVNRSGR